MEKQMCFLEAIMFLLDSPLGTKVCRVSDPGQRFTLASDGRTIRFLTSQPTAPMFLASDFVVERLDRV